MTTSPTEYSENTTISMPPCVLVTTRDGETRRVPGRVGASLMEIIRDAGIEDVPGYCGGVCSCASCHVHVAPEWTEMLSPMGEEEGTLLEAAENHVSNSRLSCQIPFSAELDGLEVAVAWTE